MSESPGRSLAESLSREPEPDISAATDPVKKMADRRAPLRVLTSVPAVPREGAPLEELERVRPTDKESALEISHRIGQLLQPLEELGVLLEYQFIVPDGNSSIDDGLIQARLHGEIADNFNNRIKAIGERKIEALYYAAREAVSEKRVGGSSAVISFFATLEQKSPGVFETYTEALRLLAQAKKDHAQQLLQQAREKTPINPQWEKPLADRTIPLQAAAPPGEKRWLRDNFPSGNFLLHATSLKEFLATLEAGQLLTPNALNRRRGGEDWMPGRKQGVTFSLNDASALNGNPNSNFIGFLVAPETVLDPQRKLIVPEAPDLHDEQTASWDEVLLVNSGHKRATNIGLVRAKIKELLSKSGLPLPLAREQTPLPTVSLADTVVVCNEIYVQAVQALLAGRGLEPKGIFVIPDKELLVKSWLQLVGDGAAAEKLLPTKLASAGLTPSLKWERDFFTEPPILDRLRVSDFSIEHSRSVVKAPNGRLISR